MKKKFMKRAASLVMASAMTLSMAMVSPFAASAEGNTLTIEPAFTTDTSGGRFEAYQIFSGSISDVTKTTGTTLSDIKWGYSVEYTPADENDTYSTVNKAETIIGKLAAADFDGNPSNNTDLEKAFDEIAAKYDSSSFTGDINDAAHDVAQVLAGAYSITVAPATEGAEAVTKKVAQPTAIELQKFSKVVKDAGIANAKKSTYASGKWTIGGLDDGYYLISDTTKTDDAVSAYMLQVLHDETVTMKAALPTVDKKITSVSSNGAVSGTTAGDTAVASIGDTVAFELSGTVPANLGSAYEYYYYQFFDEYDDSFTIKQDTISITVKGIGDDALVYDAKEIKNAVLSANNFGVTVFDTVLSGDTAGYIGDETDFLLITFSDLIPLFKDIAGNSYNTIDWPDVSIVVTYDAVLNEDANIGIVGNKNDVSIVYTNTPNIDKGGSEFKENEDTPEPPEGRKKTHPDDPDYPDDPDEPLDPGDPDGSNPPYDPHNPPEEDDDPDNPHDPNNPPSEDRNTRKRHRRKNTSTPSEVIVYTFEIDVTKRSTVSNDTTPLDGAKFKISNADNTKTAVFYKDSGVYKFVGWTTDTTTLADIVDEHDDNKAEALNKTLGVKYDTADKTNPIKWVAADFTTEVVTTSTAISIVGFAPGEYTFSETQAPNGFDKVDDFTVTLVADKETASGEYNGKLTAATKANAEATVAEIEDAAPNVLADGHANLLVFDPPASVLPDTGGAGLYFYYIGGVSFLAIGAWTMFRNKKNKFNAV